MPYNILLFYFPAAERFLYSALFILDQSRTNTTHYSSRSLHIPTAFIALGSNVR